MFPKTKSPLQRTSRGICFPNLSSHSRMSGESEQRTDAQCPNSPLLLLDPVDYAIHFFEKAR
jgi:hypothetical protein